MILATVKLGTLVKLGIVGLAGSVLYGMATDPWGMPERGTPERVQYELVQFGYTANGHANTLHDIPWYMANTPARQATIQWCHQSSERGRMPDCQNAERAASGVRGQTPVRDFMADPAYWRANPTARYATMETCRHPEWSNYRMQQPYCALAAQNGGDGR